MWTASVMAIVKMMNAASRGSRFEMGRDSSSPAYNRNCLVERFLDNTALEWILLLDADMAPPANTVSRLLSHEVDLVGASYISRHPPYLGEYADLPDGEATTGETGLRRVEWVGAGCLMVRRSVFERIPFPWFEHPVPGIDEDAIFCAKARTLGIPVYLDCGLHAGHVAPIPLMHDHSEYLSRLPGGQLGAGKHSSRYLAAFERGKAEIAGQFARAASG